MNDCPTCGKKCYASRRDAQVALKRQAQRSPSARKLLSYQCPDSDAWHLGHNQKLLLTKRQRKELQNEPKG